jgi:hypothetical protein
MFDVQIFRFGITTTVSSGVTSRTARSPTSSPRHRLRQSSPSPRPIRTIIDDHNPGDQAAHVILEREADGNARAAEDEQDVLGGRTYDQRTNDLMPTTRSQAPTAMRKISKTIQKSKSFQSFATLFVSMSGLGLGLQAVHEKTLVVERVAHANVARRGHPPAVFVQLDDTAGLQLAQNALGFAAAERH